MWSPKIFLRDFRSRHIYKQMEIKTKVYRRISYDLRVNLQIRSEAFRYLHMCLKLASSIRARNNCLSTGRTTGVLRKFRMSRIKFRALAHAKRLPGIYKSRW